MATVNKRPSGKWQATVRRDGRSLSKSFIKRADAVKWARKAEIRAEHSGLQDSAMDAVSIITLGQALERY